MTNCTVVADITVVVGMCQVTRDKGFSARLTLMQDSVQLKFKSLLFVYQKKGSEIAERTKKTLH